MYLIKENLNGKVGAEGEKKASKSLVCIPCKCAMVSEDDPVPAADEATADSSNLQQVNE
jgi:hypothetical protein